MHKSIIGFSLVLVTLLIIVAGAQQITANEFDPLNVASTSTIVCKEPVEVADRAEINSWVEECNIMYPNYGEEWRTCIIENPTSWMYDKIVMSDINGKCISITSLYEIPAQEIGKIQLQYRQRSDQNNMAFVNMEIASVSKDNLKATIMQSTGACTYTGTGNGDYRSCLQSCSDGLTCKPMNACACLL